MAHPQLYRLFVGAPGNYQILNNKIEGGDLYAFTTQSPGTVPLYEFTIKNSPETAPLYYYSTLMRLP